MQPQTLLPILSVATLIRSSVDADDDTVHRSAELPKETLLRHYMGAHNLHYKVDRNAARERNDAEFDILDRTAELMEHRKGKSVSEPSTQVDKAGDATELDPGNKNDRVNTQKVAQKPVIDIGYDDILQRPPLYQKAQAERLQAEAKKNIESATDNANRGDSTTKLSLRSLADIALKAIHGPNQQESKEIAEKWRIWWDSEQPKNPFESRTDAERLIAYVISRQDGTFSTTAARIALDKYFALLAEM